MKKIFTFCFLLLTLVATAQTADVVISVNMENETTSGDGVFLAGGADFGSPGDNPMFDDGVTGGDLVAGDDIWTITVTVTTPYTGNYTFTNGNCPDYSCKENIVGLPCADGPFSDRLLDNITANSTVTTCFSQCSTDGTCEAPAPDVDVTFIVDMNNEASMTAVGPVNIAGAVINGWCGDCTPMSDDNGDGIYDITLTLPQGALEWKYVNINWGGDEILDPDCDASCTLTSGAFTNRYLFIDGPDPIVLDTVCYRACTTCPTILDDFAGAMEVATDGVAVTLDNTGATPDGPQASCWSDDAVEGDIWVWFTAPETGTVDFETIDTGGNNDTQAAVYEGGCEAPGAEVACAEDVSSTDYMAVGTATGLTPGATYWIQIDGWDGTTGSFDMTITESSVDCPEPAAAICDNIDAYDVGSEIADGAAHWAPWPGFGYPSLVSDERAFSNARSVKVSDDTMEDNLLLLGDQETGVWDVSWMMYVPSGNSAYFNVQDTEATGTWNLDVFMNEADGNPGGGTIDQDPTTFTFPHDAWFEVSMSFDLQNDMMDFSVDGTSVLSGFAYPGNLGAINYYANGATNTYFVDDVIYDGDPLISVGEIATDIFAMYPNPTNDVLFISSDKQIENIVLRDLLGKEILSQNTIVDQITELNIGQLPAGVYMVSVQVDGQLFTQRVVKQ